MTKRVEIKIALEKFLRTADGRSGVGVVRDHRRRAILIPESLVDRARLLAAGRSLSELGRRIRVQSEDPKKEEQVFLIPSELCQISREDPGAVAGVTLPFGTVFQDHGLWVSYAPGWREVGVNDRGDVIIRKEAGVDEDASQGPVPGAINTMPAAPLRRLVARPDADSHKADRQEAEAWLKLFAAVGSGKTLRAEFKCAGIDFAHVGNAPSLYRAARLNFFDVRDFEMVRLASLLRNRFHKLRREPPRVTVISLVGIPRDQAAWAAFQKRMKSLKKSPEKLGLPGKLQESRFYDAAAKAITPGHYMFMGPLGRMPEEITVITVNVDSHGEVKARGVLSPLSMILSQIDIISAHAGAAVLNKKGTATAFCGATGAGKSTAAIFWADKNEKFRRFELRRRYEMDLRRTPDAGRMGEAGIQKELDKVMSRVGLLCQEDWIEILKEGASQWMFWPTERAMYARTTGFPGLRAILGENAPILENAAADFGGSGDPGGLGQVNHQCFPERIFYDPDWKHIHFDRTPRMIAANLFLERGGPGEFLVKRLTAREAFDWLVQGRTPSGGFEPLHNLAPDVCVMLTAMGVVGDKLAAAYESALKSDFSALGGGDPKLGQAIFERFDSLVKLWLDNCREVPTFLVNASAGLELTQDVTWALSEHSTALGEWKLVTLLEFRAFMKERYGVTYGPAGEWLHIPPSARRY